MNELVSPLWTNSSTAVVKTGTWRSALPGYHDSPSPCHNTCPVNGNIATWIQEVKAKDYYAAWVTLMDNNPFPAIAGRICHHPCETPCNRKDLDEEAVAICSLERFVGDIALQENWTIPAVDITQEKKIAVVGGGPSGLSAAYQLRRRGYAVTLLEASDQLGGLMRYGIPSYRLSKDILDGEVQRIIDLGVEVRTGVKAADTEAVKQLREEFDAVYLAIGAGRSKPLPNIDYGQSWVIDSAEFLAATNREESLQVGDHLLVIGGGSAAMDVARTARRLGKAVTVLSLEPEALLPAQREEVEEAQEEGVRFVDAAMLQSVNSEGGTLRLECIKIDFEQGATRGQFKITPIAGSEFNLEVDTVVPAIGQEVSLDQWAGLSPSEDSPVVSIDANHQTSIDGVFAGGDFASMERFVTHAVGMGKRAAVDIERYLNSDVTQKTVNTLAEIPFKAINSHYQSQAGREHQEVESLAVRLDSFAEVQRGLSVDQALEEAGRCFSCGNCIYCDNCYYYCPDMAITRLEKGYDVKLDYCKGCGLCAAECPTGTIIMQEEA